jgi:hypothetical protein
VGKAGEPAKVVQEAKKIEIGTKTGERHRQKQRRQDSYYQKNNGQ